MKSNFKLAWFHFRMAAGFFLAACAIAVLPKAPVRAALINAVEPFEWESK